MSGNLVFLAGLVTLAMIYATYTMILNFEAGWGGLWDLGPAGLIAVGAYTFAIFTAPQEGIVFAPQQSLVVGWLASIIVTAAVAYIIGKPALRLRGEYFLITTFAFSVMAIELITTESWLTAGAGGFRTITRPFDSYIGSREYNFLLCGLSIVTAFVVYLLLRRLGHSPFGRALRATRENEAAATSVGRNIPEMRLKAFVFAGALFGATAPLYIFYVRSLYPHMFGATLTFTLWTAMVIGGIGNLKGAFIGALLLIGATEATQFLQVSVEYANILAAARPILIGVALLVVIRFRPHGLFPETLAFKHPRLRALASRAQEQRTVVE